MNCKPKPQTTCGTLLSDACVVYTGPKFCFLDQEEDCFRQNEFNEAAGNLLCDLSGRVEDIESSIDLSGLTGCESFTPIRTTVKAEFQNIYDFLCTYKVDLNTPLNGSIDLECLQPACESNPIVTLKDLLQVLVDTECDTVGRAKVYKATIKQNDVFLPVPTILENTLGTVVWARSASGVITATLTGAFANQDKVFVLVGPMEQYLQQITFDRTDANTLTFTAYNNLGVASDLFHRVSIEIRVYP